jgi:hypothetical protein
MYLFTFFKNVHSVLNKILIENGFFKTLIHYLFEYEWNNLYQHNCESLLKYYLNSAGNYPEISKHLFEDLKLLDLLMNYGNVSGTNQEDRSFQFNSNRKINHGFFAIVIGLCYKISQMGKEVSEIKNQFSSEWELFMQEKVLYWVKLFERRLCQNENPSSAYVSEDINTNIHIPENFETTTEGQTENPFKKEDNLFAGGNVS